MSEVIALAGWSPEVLAYAYAMYSRSKLSIRESIKKISEEKSEKFFEQYYFGFGHKSIADNAHISLSFENISQIAAFELEDQSLWDGQERSTRYQSFDTDDNIFIPASIQKTPFESKYVEIAESLMERYRYFSAQILTGLSQKYSKPSNMDDDVYVRTLKARAFDVARYCLFNGIKTNVGQITSARTLEEQSCRLLSSPYEEIRDLGLSIKKACNAKPFCPEGKDEPPVAPTLLKYVDANRYLVSFREELTQLADRLLVNIPFRKTVSAVEMAGGYNLLIESVATLLYQHSHRSYADILDFVWRLKEKNQEMIFNLALAERGTHDAWPRAFASGYKLQFDIVMDRGGERDLHRHRNCIQIHQPLTTELGWEKPDLIVELGLGNDYDDFMLSMSNEINNLNKKVGVEADYLIPFAFRSATLYKQNLSQVAYVTELRSTPAGHFSYRKIACQMHELMLEKYPFLAGVMRVTPFEDQDIFKR